MTKPLFSWRHAILESDLPPTTRHVLLTLSCHMNDVGESCYPTIDTLARETGLSKRAVITHIQSANKLGWIKVGEHGFRGQRWRSHEYSVGMPASEGGASSSPASIEMVVNLVPEGGEPRSKNSEKVVNDVHSNSTVINSTGNSRNCANKSRSPKRATQLPDDFEPNDTNHRVAVEHGVDIHQQLPQFCDYHRAKGSTMKDWHAALNTWIRNAKKFDRSTNHEASGRHRKETPLEEGVRLHNEVCDIIDSGRFEEWWNTY